MGFQPGSRRCSLCISHPHLYESHLRSLPVIDSWKHSPSQVSDISLRFPPSTPSPCYTYPFILLALWPSLLFLSTPDPQSPHSPTCLLSHPVPSLHLPPIIILLLLLSEIQATSHKSSFLFSSGSMECIMGNLYFIVRVHLSFWVWIPSITMIFLRSIHLTSLFMMPLRAE